MSTFATHHGFKSDPFQSTNAENEGELEAYFVPPPYFATVLGDPKDPASSVVFAPRGGGKTAQRLMLESEAADQDEYLCLTYDTFDLGGTNLLNNPTLDAHLVEVSRLMTVGILERLAAMESDGGLDERDRQIVKAASELFLGRLDAMQYKRAIQSVKSFGQKASDFWHRYGGVVAVGIAALMKKAGLDPIQLPEDLKAQMLSPDGSARFFYSELLRICQELGWSSVYVLVDKVDETPGTSSDAGAAFKLIAPLLVDLPTLEARGVAFKFFLWDQTEDAFQTGGGRPDRVQVVTLNWSASELARMMARRLSSFSDGAVESFNSMLCSSVTIDAHKLLAYLGNGSPRDMIRMAATIVAEQTRDDPGAACISEAALMKGIETFSFQRCQELYPDQIGDLQKVGRASFTITTLSGDVFRISVNAARAKVQQWMNSGAAEKIGELPNTSGRPTHLYAFTDPRLAITTRGKSARQTLDNEILICGGCSRIVMTNHDSIDCPHCSTPIERTSSQSLLQICLNAD